MSTQHIEMPTAAAAVRQKQLIAMQIQARMDVQVAMELEMEQERNAKQRAVLRHEHHLRACVISALRGQAQWLMEQR